MTPTICRKRGVRITIGIESTAERTQVMQEGRRETDGESAAEAVGSGGLWDNGCPHG